MSGDQRHPGPGTPVAAGSPGSPPFTRGIRAVPQTGSYWPMGMVPLTRPVPSIAQRRARPQKVGFKTEQVEEDPRRAGGDAANHHPHHPTPLTEEGPTVFDAELRNELLRRMERDQAVRTAVPVGQPLPAEIDKEWDAVEAGNTAFLKEVIARRGWPGADVVGEDAAHAAWMLAQHADADPEFQRGCLPLLRAAVEAGQAKPSQWAYLIDRVRGAEGRRQVYGTQYWTQAGVLRLRPIEDPAHLDERRARVGLAPQADYDRTMRELYE
ncbi:DUF6624 domain-containing protein (plasmid) [Streptosporangium sp. CA-135522]|uniref:DUF6624 domain-containing protein n=1 Tax=Streptosporangium sp. CA-135522 TaxID=3240072 RepID=UPI003D8A0EBA